MCIQTEVLNLANLVHTYSDRTYIVHFLDSIDKKIVLFAIFKQHFKPTIESSTPGFHGITTTTVISPRSGSHLQSQGQFSSGFVPPSPPSLLFTLSFVCQGIFAYLLNTLLATYATKVLSLSSNAVEVVIEVCLILNWKHGFPDTAIEEVNRLRAGMKSTEKGKCITRLCSQARK